MSEFVQSLLLFVKLLQPDQCLASIIATIACLCRVKIPLTL